jgi:hypothetical protein
MPEDMQPAALGSDPEIAFCVLLEGEDAVGIQVRLEAGSRDGVVETVETVIGPNP